jgi:hypothetical protein
MIRGGIVSAGASPRASYARFGTSVKQQVGFGYGIDRLLVRPLSDFPGNDQQRASFIRDVLPRSSSRRYRS